MTDNPLATWSVVMPVKVLTQAKSRLAGLAGPRRGELALALACDTVTAVLACDEAARVIVITDDQVAGVTLGGLGALVVPDEPRDGLNAALRHGAAYVAARWPGTTSAPRPLSVPPATWSSVITITRAAASHPSTAVTVSQARARASSPRRGPASPASRDLAWASTLTGITTDQVVRALSVMY